MLIKGGRIVDPLNGIDEILDLRIENGKIAETGKNLTASTEVIDASGKVVAPGLIDLHVHLRDPGREDEETIYSGTRAAAKGGFTSIVSMANTEPPADTPSVIEYILSKAKHEGAVNVFPCGAVTKGLRGEELAEMGRLVEEGVVAFSDDGIPIMNAEVMRRALEYARQFGRPIISHAEDLKLAIDGVMNESYLSTIFGLKGIPGVAEEVMVARDILLAREFGRVHFAHISTAGAVKLIRRAKEENIPVTAETAPHYFTLTEAEVEGYQCNAKIKPPLRGEADVAAVIEGLKDGTLDAIATDHAPHLFEEKNLEYNLAAFGIVGLETALALVITELVHTKTMTLSEALAKLTVNPARIVNLPKGTLSRGADADITIFDLNAEWTVDAKRFASRSRNTPYDGWKLKGKVIHTIVGGKLAVRDGELTI